MHNDLELSKTITDRMGPERKEMYLALEKYAGSYFDQYLDEIHTSIIMAGDNGNLTKYHEILDACKEFEKKIMDFFVMEHIQALEDLGYNVTIERKNA